MNLKCPDCGAVAIEVGGFDLYEIAHFNAFQSNFSMMNMDGVKYEISCPECMFTESYYSVEEAMRIWEDSE